MDRRRFLPTYHYEDNTTGLLEDSVGKPLRDYKIYGNSLQNGTPTPETPVEIESVGDKTANLFDENVLSKFATALTNDEEWVIKNFAGVINDGISFKENTRYTLAFTAKQTAGNPRLIFKYTDGTSNNIGTWQLATNYTAYVGTSTANKTIAYIGMVYGSTGFTYILKGSMQLVEGVYNASTMPEYEPFGYKVPIKVSGEPYTQPQTTNIYLAEPLRKIGEYADYVDFKNGCVVRNTQKLILDSSLNPWTYTYKDMIGAAFSSVLSEGGSRYIGLCTHSDKVQTGTLSGTIWCGDAGSTTVCWLGILDILGMDITEFKTWLDSQETPVEVICGRNTPTEEPLELPPIPTIKGTTTVTADTAVRPSEVMWQYYRK